MGQIFTADYINFIGGQIDMEGEKVFALVYEEIQKGKNIDIEEYISKVDECEQKDFREIVEISVLSQQIRNASKFDALFEKINGKKIELYNAPQAVNFRSDENNKSDEKIIDEIFEREFGDENE